MRLLLALLFCTSTAFAQTTTTHLILPSYGGSSIEAYPGVDVMVCATIPARLGIDDAIHMAGGVNSNGASGAVCSWAIYPDDDTGTALGIVTDACTTYGIKTETIAAADVVQGTRYRLCACSNKSGNYLAISEGDIIAPLFRKNLAMNAATTRIGIAANACSAGVAQTTTGALSPTSDLMPPMILLEKP